MVSLVQITGQMQLQNNYHNYLPDQEDKKIAMA